MRMSLLKKGQPALIQVEVVPDMAGYGYKGGITMRRRAFLSSLLFIATWVAFTGAPHRLAAQRFPNRPKLVVILVIDQFRYDYLMRFRPYFGKAGFNMLLDGAVFTDCRYDYATTITGPGHATLLTGAYSNIHGIIENDWYDPVQHRKVYCVADPSTQIVASRAGPSSAPGFSPRNLIGSTLGDELRAATNFRSKVITISLKDRAAILMGGHAASAAYWYDPATAGFVTSTYYASALPSWLDEFNHRSPAKEFCGQDWRALPETPGAAGEVFSQFVRAKGESCPDSKFLSWLGTTPYPNKIELEAATAAIRGERLGQGRETDLLAISLSINDSIGHRFGPYSLQVADTTLRTDRYLAAFFAELDKLVGLNNVWVTLSADHGVAPNPAFVDDHKLGPGNVQPAAIRTAVEKALIVAFGEGPWVEDLDEFYIYLNHATLKEHNVSETKAEEVAAEAAAALPEVAAAFTRTQFLTGSLPPSPLARKAANSFNPRRSGDVFLVLMPYAVAVSGSTETTHGTPWSYDSQVPLIFWGGAFKPGFYATACQPIDLAATLAAVLGLTQPSDAQGTPLVGALK
jgi:predicted AlkP superfamily pyrophosphatase or phosphodiesterase